MSCNVVRCLPRIAMKIGRKVGLVLLLYSVACNHVSSLPVSDRVCSFQIHGSDGPSSMNASVHCLGPDAVALTVAPVLCPFVSEFTGTVLLEHEVGTRTTITCPWLCATGANATIDSSDHISNVNNTALPFSALITVWQDNLTIINSSFSNLHLTDSEKPHSPSTTAVHCSTM